MKRGILQCGRGMGLLVLLLWIGMVWGCGEKDLPAVETAPYGIAAPKDVRPENPIVFYPATELAARIRAGELTSLGVVDTLLEHIRKHNSHLNAIVTLDETAARERARQADAALARGEIWGPLHGVPVTVKDHFATAGLRTTNGYPPLAGQIPAKDATVVARLKAAGAIILGKTNLPQLSLDFQTFNSIFGRTNNPWDVGRTPGGSTGGGAAAVSCGMSPLEIGSDYAGSIRLPAHFCGIYGFKATENFISGHGSFPGVLDDSYRTVRHMVSYGCLARSIADLKLCLSVIGGADPLEPDVPVVPRTAATVPALGRLRVAWSAEFGGVTACEDARRVLGEFVQKLAGAGCQVRQTQPADFDYQTAWRTWGEIKSMEVDTTLSAFSRFCVYVFGSLERRRIPIAAMVFPTSFEHYMEALTRRDRLVSSMETFFTRWDVFLCPVSATPAFPHSEPAAVMFKFPLYFRPLQMDDTTVNYWVANSSFTAPSNLTGNPAVVIPAGFSREGLPIGIQVIGPRWRDFELLEIAARLDAVAGDYRPPAGF